MQVEKPALVSSEISLSPYLLIPLIIRHRIFPLRDAAKARCLNCRIKAGKSSIHKLLSELCSD